MINEQILFDSRDLIVKIDDLELNFGDVQLDIKSNINEHSILKLNISLYDDELDESIYTNEEKKISIEIEKEFEGEPIRKLLFAGYITNIKNWRERENKYVTFDALSMTYKLDQIKRNISYQDINKNYEEILDSIRDRYESIGIIGENLSLDTQDRLLIQYTESDWEYINRIASLKNKPLINIGTGLRIGFNSNSAENNLDIYTSQYYMNNNLERKYLEHNIKSGQIFLLGESVNVDFGDKEEELTVVSCTYTLEDSILVAEYNMINKFIYKREEIKNMKLAGKALEGKVVEILDVEGIAKMKVTFNTELSKREEELGIDVQIGTELFEFPYVTPYSQSHTGYFCTPEVDDNVIVYFPDEMEEHGYVLGAINSIGNGRFTNRVDRNFIIPSVEEEGEPLYEMNLNSDIFKFKTGAYIKEIMNEDIKVEENSLLSVTGNKSVNVEGNVDYAVNGNYSYKVDKDYQIQAENIKSKANSNFNGEGGSAMNLKGGKMNIEGKSASNIKGGSVKIGGGSVSVGS